MMKVCVINIMTIKVMDVEVTVVIYGTMIVEGSTTNMIVDTKIFIEVKVKNKL